MAHRRQSNDGFAFRPASQLHRGEGPHRVTIGWDRRTAAIVEVDRFSLPQALAGDVLITHHHDLPGLIPQRPGPKRPHKLTNTVLDFARQQQARDPSLRAAALAALIRDTFRLSVHPRSIERALMHQPKKSRRMGSRRLLLA